MSRWGNHRTAGVWGGGGGQRWITVRPDAEGRGNRAARDGRMAAEGGAEEGPTE